MTPLRVENHETIGYNKVWTIDQDWCAIHLYYAK